MVVESRPMDVPVTPPLTDEKCGPDMAGMPGGGPSSFAEMDAYEQARHAEHEVRELGHHYQAIVANVFANPDTSLAQKTALLKAAASDLQKRVGPAIAEEEKALADGQTHGWSKFNRMRGILRKNQSASRGDEASGDDAPKGKKADSPMLPKGSAFLARKDLNGKWRWLAVSSNTFVDREGESFTKEAHEHNVRAIEETKAYPDLRLWHVPGSAIGVTDMMDVTTEGFVVASGTFNEGFEDVAERLKERGPLGVSHGYRYMEQDKVDGVFHRYMDYELSVLPIDRAANADTGFLAGQEIPEMSMSKEKKDFVANVLGVELADTLERTLETAAAKAAETGVGFKELMEAVGDVAAPEVPAPVEAPVAAASPDVSGFAALLREQLAPITEQLGALAATQAAQTKELAALKETDDAKVASMMTARNAPFGAGYSASTAGDNVADGRSADVKAAKAGEAAGPTHLREHLGMLGISAIGQQG